MRVLYRNESFMGSGWRDAVSVITHEICELGNADVLDYCLEHYDLSRMHFDDTVRALRDSVDAGEDVDEYGVRLLVADLLKHVESCTGYCVRYALWLAGMDTVMSDYDGEEDRVDAYECGPVVLSDLGWDGVLFGYSNLPKKRP